MAKLILVDNLNRETIADVLIEENLSDKEATQKADDYNSEHSNRNWDWFAKAVNDDYKLWGGIEEFI